MSRLTITVGLPASGKTTWALRELQKDGNTLRVNKDELRPMLHGEKPWSGKQEGKTIAAQRGLVKGILEKGYNVIVDDTNLNEGIVEAWKQLAREGNYKFHLTDFATDVDTCFERDSGRSTGQTTGRANKSVGRHVIARMAIQHGRWHKDKRTILCDLDGTVADISHRLKYIQGPAEERDYTSFFSTVSLDVPKKDVIEKLFIKAAKQSVNNILFVSGRSDISRKDTELWITEHLGVTNPIVFMRRHGDHSPDTVLKENFYKGFLKNLEVVTVFDDRPSVIRMWRSHGLHVTDCGNGVEF